MIEPTESEDKAEIDRFCEALDRYQGESRRYKTSHGTLRTTRSNAPHTVEMLTAESWDHQYTRQEAAYPLHWVKEGKFWPSVARINNSYGDRHLVCTCPDVASYA
jgi:glycine dehydrogenase